MSRLKSSRGMTFMELLCAVLILMMSTALVLVGVNLALTPYRANMEASEAQVLYSTLTTVISDKLRYCGTVETAEELAGGETYVSLMKQNLERLKAHMG